MTEGLGVDTAFDAIGSEQTALQVIDAVAPGGRAVLVGIPAFAPRAPISPSQMVYGEKVISGTYYGSVRPNIDFPILGSSNVDHSRDGDAPVQVAADGVVLGRRPINTSRKSRAQPRFGFDPLALDIDQPGTTG